MKEFVQAPDDEKEANPDGEIRILHLEDQSKETELARALLQRAGIRARLERVDSLPAFLNALEQNAHNLILSDCSMPGMDTFEALRLTRDRYPDVPFIFFSGTLGQDQVIEALKLGATDCILKQNVARFIPAVRRALREAEQHARCIHAEESMRQSDEKLQAVLERQRAEANLRESEAKFRTLADNISQLAWMADEAGWIFWYNKRWFDYTGTTLPQVEGWGWQKVHHPDHVERVVGKIRRSFQTGEPWEDTFPLRAKDGTYRWFLSRATPICDGSGKVVRWFGTNTDITQQRLAEEAQKRSEERYRSFVEASAQVVWRTNPYGAVDEPISSWNAYTGQTDAEAAGFGWVNAIFPEDKPQVFAEWSRASAARSVYEVEYRLRRYDGQWRHILARGVPVLEKSGSVREYIGTCKDVTEVRDTEIAMRRQARLIDLSPVATMVRNLDGTITFWSQGAERLYGWTRPEALGRFTHNLLRTRFPEPMESILKQLVRGRRWSGELVHLTKDGHEVVVESHWLAQVSSAGEITEILESNLDVTARKHTEGDLRRLKQELEQRVEQRTAELQEALGELELFSYTITHDMRGPLRAISSFAGILQEDAAESLSGEQNDFLRRISESALRMDLLITDALNYSRAARMQLDVRPVDPAVAIRGIIESYPQFQPPSAEILMPRNLPLVLANEAALTQCFSNLLGNAVKFVAPGVRPRIRIRGEIISTNGGPQGPIDPAAGVVRLWFEDNGIGINPEYHDKIWQMFHRLEKNYEGTGIGLALVRKVVERMKGRVGVESSPGQGSRFWVELPHPVDPRSNQR